jgi:histidinol phosphatase-like enzyme (inositol monophosphatase family)
MTGPAPELAARLDLAVSAAREAGQLTLAFFQREDLTFERKADDSPVTEADRQAERLLRRRIHENFPDDGILGEEFGEQAGTSGFRWILDPIDGTKSFICGVPLYGTLIGVERSGTSVVGVIHLPGLDECVYAASGGGAWYTHGSASPRPARVSQRDRVSDAVVLTSQLDNYYPRGAHQAYLELERAAYITRMWGDCYGYLLVATGRADVMVDPVMNVWDAAALQPVLEEAGGVYTDWSGRPTIHGGEGIGCNRLLLDQVLAITRRFVRGCEKMGLAPS